MNTKPHPEVSYIEDCSREYAKADKVHSNYYDIYIADGPGILDKIFEAAMLNAHVLMNKGGYNGA